MQVFCLYSRNTSKFSFFSSDFVQTSKFDPSREPWIFSIARAVWRARSNHRRDLRRDVIRMQKRKLGRVNRFAPREEVL